MALAARSISRAQITTQHRRSQKRAALVVRRYKNGDEPQQEAEAAVTQPQGKDKARVVFQLPHHVEWGQDMCVVGEVEALGAWDVDRCVPMAWHDGDVWTAEAELPKGTDVQYKYIVREGREDDEGVKDVHEWQPCNNLELQVQDDLQEVTVRDAWEATSHEVLPGILPIPVPPPPPSLEVPAATLPDAVPAAEPAPASPAVPAASVLDPAATSPVDVEELVGGSAATSNDELEGPAAALPAAGSLDTSVITAEQIAAATPDPKQAPAKAAASATPAVLGGGQDGPVAAGGDGAHDTVHAGGGNIREHIKEVRKEDATVPAWLKQASTDAADITEDFNGLPTSDLKELCKKRGLPSKGQRSQLLARLQQKKA